MKKWWIKKKILVNSIFSFSHNVFYHIKDINYHFSYMVMSSADAVNLVKTNILSFDKDLKMMTIVNLVSFCDTLSLYYTNPDF